MLSSIVLAALSSARAKARDMVRLSDLKQLQIALEMYRVENGHYPISGADTGIPPKPPFRSGVAQCMNGVFSFGYGASGYIPGLVPDFISELPEDPAKLTLPSLSPRCYAYASNGADYMVMARNSEGYKPPINLRRQTGGNLLTIAVFTQGAVGW